jgi:2-hydroxychromene-2-carboxylate isomerase
LKGIFLELLDIEFLFDFASPNCYVLHGELRRFCKDHDLDLIYSPLFLGGLFKLTGDSALPKNSLEYNYMAKNLERFSKIINIPFKFSHERFPINSLKALRGYYYARDQGKDESYIRKVFESCWGLDEDITQVSVLRKIVESLGFDPEEYFSFIEKEETKQLLKNGTQKAFDRGVFGAPTVFLGGEMFWGTPGEVLWNISRAHKLTAGTNALHRL